MQTIVQSLSPSQNERYWAASAHFLALALALMTAWFAGIAGIVGAGIVYLLKRGDSAFIAEHSREAINFNLSMLLYSFAAIALAIVLVGTTVLTLGIGIIVTAPAGILLMLLVAVIAVMWLVCSVVAGIKALNGESFRYPLSLRWLR